MLRCNVKYLAGVSILALIVLWYGIALSQVLSFGIPAYSFHDLLQDTYLRQVIWFSFYQAFICASLTLILAWLGARAFFYTSFRFKSSLLNGLNLAFVLPPLLVVLGIIGVFGYSGWLKHLGQLLGFKAHWRIYGLGGIILAHLFFNLPFATNLFLQSLNTIPSSHFKLAQQLQLRGLKFMRWVELPKLKSQLLPTFILVFMLCFSSFTVILTLGGSPKYTTLEVAIYQSIFFEFNLAKASIFAMVQGVICLSLFSLSHWLNKTPLSIPANHSYLSSPSELGKFFHYLIIVLLTTFALLPILNLVVKGLFSPQLMQVLNSQQLWQALGTSILIALSAGGLTLSLALGILTLTRNLWWQGKRQIANGLLNFTMVLLAIPSLVLALGLYLNLRNFSSWNLDNQNWVLGAIVVVCNSLLALPLVISILKPVMYNHWQNYYALTQALGLQGFKAWRWVEYPALQGKLKYAFALAGTLAIGNFTIIALFGNADFTSLPLLLYQQMANYDYTSASVTALVLLLFCGGFFSGIKYD